MKNNFWFLSALLLAVHSPAHSMANPSVASGSQVQAIKVPVLETADNALKEELTQPPTLVAQASPTGQQFR